LSSQNGDVLLCQTIDGGEIESINGLITMSSGLDTSAYLSLFGGNEDDDGSDTTPHQYWGNLLDTESSRKYRSETQYLLKSVPATTSNLGRIEDAVNRDLQWYLDENIANSIGVTVTLIGVNKVNINIIIIGAEGDIDINFLANWEARRVDGITNA
jgi:phage gp46-like protein